MLSRPSRLPRSTPLTVPAGIHLRTFPEGFSLEDFTEAIRVGLEKDFPEMEHATKRQTLHRFVLYYKEAQVAALAIQDNGKTRAELYLELFHRFFDDPVARCAG